VSNNIKEIILTGVNIGDFGRKTGESFADLLRELIKIEGLERVRISSIEPNLLTDEIIELVSKSEKLMPHFHIPLQSGSNKILKLMQRRYLRKVFATRVSKAKALIPNCFIAADVIVGFPNEQVEDFEETFQFLEQMDLQALHVFSYSIRPNTIAGEMDQQVPEYQKKIRSKRLIELSSKMTLDFYHKQVGKVFPILAEGSQHQGNMSGFTPNYIKCSFPYNNNLSNKIIQGRIEQIDTTTETAIVNIINN
jgi:threonylcarbamoyladenosine tRNA methylthiotransferase MtaB